MGSEMCIRDSDSDAHEDAARNRTPLLADVPERALEGGVVLEPALLAVCKVICYLCAGTLPRSDTRSCKSAEDGTWKRRSRSAAEARWFAPSSRAACSCDAPTSSSSNID